MTEGHNADGRDALQEAVAKRLDEIPEDTLDPQSEEKLLKIKALSAQELGELMVEAAATRFHKPSLLARLDDCANILIDRLGLAEAKDVQLTTSRGMATMWRLRVGAYPSAIFSLLARFSKDSFPTVAGELRYADIGQAARAQGVPFEEAVPLMWHVEEQVPSADPETYTRACLEHVGVLGPEEPEMEPEEEPTY